LKYSISIIINYSSTTFKLSQSLANGYSGHFKGAGQLPVIEEKEYKSHHQNFVTGGLKGVAI